MEKNLSKLCPQLLQNLELPAAPLSLARGSMLLASLLSTLQNTPCSCVSLDPG